MGRVKGTPTRSIKSETVKDLRKKLKALPKAEELGVSKTDAIRELRPEIEAAREEKGYSYKKIAEILSEAGLVISGPGIRMVLTSTDEAAANAPVLTNKTRK
jgi:hypothetical protein